MNREREDQGEKPREKTTRGLPRRGLKTTEKHAEGKTVKNAEGRPRGPRGAGPRRKAKGRDRREKPGGRTESRSQGGESDKTAAYFFGGNK